MTAPLNLVRHRASDYNFNRIHPDETSLQRCDKLNNKQQICQNPATTEEADCPSNDGKFVTTETTATTHNDGRTQQVQHRNEPQLQRRTSVEWYPVSTAGIEYNKSTAASS